MSEEDRKGISKIHLPEYGVQRDIFIFQCFIGCRVGDLLNLTSGNIVDGILTYTLHKTKDNGDQAVQARVPLPLKAMELVKKYEGVSKQSMLFPLILWHRATLRDAHSSAMLISKSATQT